MRKRRLEQMQRSRKRQERKALISLFLRSTVGLFCPLASSALPEKILAYRVYRLLLSQYNGKTGSNVS